MLAMTSTATASAKVQMKCTTVSTNNYTVALKLSADCKAPKKIYAATVQQAVAGLLALPICTPNTGPSNTISTSAVISLRRRAAGSRLVETCLGSPKCLICNFRSFSRRPVVHDQAKAAGCRVLIIN